jgi:hypothetical protein
MRTKQIVPGFKNKQRVRAIVNGVGYITTIQDLVCGPFSTQTTALLNALHIMKTADCGGVGTTIRTFDHEMKEQSFQIQLDML